MQPFVETLAGTLVLGSLLELVRIRFGKYEMLTTTHYFDPCDLLVDNARSELLPEARVRQHGGGWQPKCG